MRIYCAYIRMLSGRLAYETFKANTQHTVPCLRSVDRYIKQVESNATEGVLRSDELLQYLNHLKLPKIVALSEDATRVINRIQYDSRTNQLVGFVLPLGENSMPIADFNRARSAAEMERCFYNCETGKEKKRASFVNVVMAQPLVPGIPAFCLLLFGTDAMYSSNDIAKRWQFIKNELKKKDIEVVTFASDSDPKFNSFMKYHINLGQDETNNINFPEWFNAKLCINANFMPIQDIVHIGTKFRNRILNYTLKMGNCDISVEHLSILLDTYTKEKHNLCPSTIMPKDRQNFESVLRICDEKVIDLLTNVRGSDGTILYLRVLNCILRSFLDLRLTPLERIRKIWFATFILRIWKTFLLESNMKYKEYSNLFISQNCYVCVEINAHSIVLLMLYLRERKLDHLFHPEMLGSQQCESIFRQIRSLSSTYSTVTNCSILEIIQKMSKIELQNEISHNKLKHWNFPRIGLPSSSYFPTIDRNGMNHSKTRIQLSSQQEIIQEIELAKIEAIEYAETIGMNLKNSNGFVCKIPKNTLSVRSEEINQNNQNSESDKDVLQLFKTANLKQYSEKFDPQNVDEESAYVKVKNNDGKIVCLKKHTLCWFLTKTTSKLSSDRLLRSMAKS